MGKNRRNFRPTLAAALALLSVFVLPLPALSAEISGGAYGWEDLSPVRPAVFSINTTPAQTVVSESGKYSFSVQGGTYLLTAEGFRNGERILEDSSVIQVLAEGSYRIDFILFPAVPEAGQIDDEQVPAPELPSKLVPESPLLLPALAFLLAAALALWAYFGFRLPTKSGEPNAAVRKVRKIRGTSGRMNGAKRNRKLPRLGPELSEIVDRISQAGGRIVQRELRRSLPYSEAKASLLLSELEARGIVRKYKRGRANLLVLSRSREE